MYPYKEEAMSSIRAFCLAWLLILTPIFTVATVLHFVLPQAEQS